MIGRTHRFHGRNSLNPVYKNGNTVRSSMISLKYTSRGTKPYRVAVVVSRKVHKSAVVRNRIRRRIYEICRKQTNIDLAGKDLIFTIFSDQLASMEHDKLESTINGLLVKTTEHRSNVL